MPRSADREKQPASLASAINHNLSLYALAAGAAGVPLLALAQPSEAEVVYTSAHKVIGRNQLFSFDLNHDGINDFTIFNTFSRSGTYVRFHLKVAPVSDGAIIYSSADYGAAALDKGASIAPGGAFRWTREVMAARSDEDGSIVTYGGWFGAKNKYLGLNFVIDGRVHFGWARLNVQWNRKFLIVATLTGYAYETVPGKAIIAGDTGGAADEESLTKPMGGFPQQEVRPATTLAALSLGAPGLSIWRRPTP
jgi:hypothetical protein